MIIQAFFQRNKNNNNKKENSCIEWKISEGLFTKLGVRSPGVASLFFSRSLFPPPPWVIIVFLQYHNVSSDITSEERYADADRSNCL